MGCKIPAVLRRNFIEEIYEVKKQEIRKQDLMFGSKKNLFTFVAEKSSLG